MQHGLLVSHHLNLRFPSFLSVHGHSSMESSVRVSVLHPRYAIFAERLTAFNFKIGEVVITDEGVVQSIFAVVDFGRERVHGISSLSCGVGHEGLLQLFDCLFLPISFRRLILSHHNTREKKKKSEPIPNRD